MPIVTVTLRAGHAAERKTAILEAAQAALVANGVNPRDRFHRVIELPADGFVYDPTFPDAATPRGDDFVLIEILLGVGRSVKVKKHILAALMERLVAAGLDPEHVMVVFLDVPWENWSPAGGRVPHA